MPPMPETDTMWARPSSAVACSSCFSIDSSRTRPTNGGSRPSVRPSPRSAPTTRSARHSSTGCDLPLSSKLPAASWAIAASVARRVASSTSTVPGSAAAWIRAVVLTTSPATMPWPSAPSVTATLPVETPARSARSTPASAPSACTAETRSSAVRTARSASSSCATGAPHSATTASPMNFSSTPP